MPFLTKAQIFSALRQIPRQVLVPLSLAILSLAALFIPAAEYIQWDNYVGLSFSVLAAFFVVKSVLPESLSAMLANRWWRIGFSIASLALIVLFFYTDHPRGIFENPNIIEIYPKEPGFAIRRLEGQGKILPCTGYIPKDCREGWHLSIYQSYVAKRNCEHPFILALSTEFIQSNGIAVRVNAPSAGEAILRINGQKRTVKVARAERAYAGNNPGETTIPLNQFDLLPPLAKRHTLIDLVQLSGQLCIAFLAIGFVLQLIATCQQGPRASWPIMALLIAIVCYFTIPNLLDWGISRDLKHLEPNRPYPLNGIGFKHPLFIQVWWQIAMTFIPVRSCWLAPPIAFTLLYSSALLMVGKLLSSLKKQWLAWLISGAMLQCAYLVYDRRTLVDYLVLVSAMFAVGCLTMLMCTFNKSIKKPVLIGGCLFSIYTVMAVRHEALGVALALCIGLAGVFLHRCQWSRGRLISSVLLSGILICGALNVFHRLVEQKILLPIKNKTIATVYDDELRRLIICDILRIAYCYNPNLTSLPHDFCAHIDERLHHKFLTRGFHRPSSIDSFPTEKLKQLWLYSIKTYPKAYLKSKITSVFLWSKLLDSQIYKGSRHFLAHTVNNDVSLPNGTMGLNATKLHGMPLLPAINLSTSKSESFLEGIKMPLPTPLALLSLVICVVLSGALLCIKLVFRSIVWLAFVVSSAGLMHLLAWIALPVTILPRYIYWTYCSGTISFCLLLYLIPNVVKCLLKKQSWDVLYAEPTEEQP